MGFFYFAGRVRPLLEKLDYMLEIEQINRLYKQGKSATEIGKDLGVPWRKVIYLMDKHGIERRSRSEAIYCKHNPNGDPFKIKIKLTTEEESLKALALGLYWGEGSRYNPISIRLTNSDPSLLRVFIKFLQSICGVNLQKIRLWLTVHTDTPIKKAEQYWSNQLNIPLSQFSKTVVINHRGNGTYKKKSLYGTATVCVHNMKLRQIMQKWLDEYAHVAQSVEHMHGKPEVTGSIPVVGSGH